MSNRKQVLNLVEMSPEHTKRLNEIAEKEKKNYTELIDMFSEKYGDSRFWWATPLASRNTFLERCFLSFCIVKLVLELLKETPYDEIVVPLHSIKKCLEENLQNVKIIWQGDEKNLIRNRHRLNRANLKYFYETVKFNKKAGRRKKDFGEFKGKQVILVDTDDTIGTIVGTEYKDRNFGGLSENTDESIIYCYTPCYTNKSDGKKIITVMNGKSDRVMYESYFKWVDIFEIFRYWLFCNRVSFKDSVVDGIDLKWIFEGELKYGECSINSFYGLIKSKALFRFIKSSGIKVKGIVGWYEGQPSSNALFFEVRRQTNIPTMAYIATPVYEFNLALSPSKIQMKMKGTAEYFAIQGEMWKEQIKEYAPEIRIVRAPSFRYQSLFEKSSARKGGDEILLILPYSEKLSRDMILMVDGLKTSKKGITLKNHPYHVSKTLGDYGIEKKDLNHTYEFVQGNMVEALNGVNVAIVSMTTSALELLVGGVKVIVWNCPGVLRASCVPNKILKDGIIKSVYTVEELEVGIEERDYLKLEKEELQEIRDQVFTEVSPETVSNFLKVFSGNRDLYVL